MALLVTELIVLFLSAVFNGNGKGEDDSEQVQVDSTNAWGSQTLFQFKYFDNGNYALVTASSASSKIKYLSSEGTCLDIGEGQATKGGKLNGSNGVHANGAAKEWPPKNCLFTIEYHGGFIAFRDKCGRYLAAAGRQAVLRTRSTAVGKDELFEFEPAPLQVAFRATFNNKWVSIKQGKSKGTSRLGHFFSGDCTLIGPQQWVINTPCRHYLLVVIVVNWDNRIYARLCNWIALTRRSALIETGARRIVFLLLVRSSQQCALLADATLCADHQQQPI